MKQLLVVVAILTCICCNAAENKDRDAQRVAAGAQSESVQPESTVIFQGLIAYVENGSGDTGPPVEALLVNALPDPNVNMHNATGPLDLLSGKPAILNAEIVSKHKMILPPHEPFVAVVNGTIEGANCFVGNAKEQLLLDWERLETRGKALNLEARRLCQTGACGTLKLRLGDKPLDLAKVDLENLVDAADFGAHNCQAGFFKLDSNLADKLAARVEILTRTAAKAKVLNCTTCYNTHELKGEMETACGSGDGKKYAEQVEIVGSGEVVLERNGEFCKFIPEAGKSMEVWIFNVHAGSYRYGHVLPHHPAFYWYYNLASTPCKTINGENVYPRLCPGSVLCCSGDPKCPQAKLTR